MSSLGILISSGRIRVAKLGLWIPEDSFAEADIVAVDMRVLLEGLEQEGDMKQVVLCKVDSILEDGSE